MATQLKNLSEYDFDAVPDACNMKFAIVVSEWNRAITLNLLDGCYKTLLKHGALEENILISYVPGSFELTYGTKMVVENHNIDAAIALGCVIQGETRHFDYICESVTLGVTHLNLAYDIPVVFGVLTTNDIQQARDRSGGKHGNKGDEAAVTAIKMAQIKQTNE